MTLYNYSALHKRVESTAKHIINYNIRITRAYSIYWTGIECEKAIQLSEVINLTTVRPRRRAVINGYCDGDNNSTYPIIILNKDSDNGMIYYKLLYVV